MTFVIADDHERERIWIRDLLTKHFSQHAPIYEATDGESAANLVAAHSPILVCLDIEMPKLSGIKAAEAILQRNSATGIVIISNHANEIWVRQLWKIVPNDGAFAYVLKDSSDKQIIEAVQTVLNGDCWVHPRIQRVLLKASDASTLSSGEFEVLAYICLGLTDRAISKRIYITEKAIQARLKSVYQKLGIPLRGANEDDEYNHRCRAVNLAIRKNLINTAQLDEWEKTLRIESL